MYQTVRRPETVVDYDAWKRGYMPPSEHILIDQLAYRGATVNTSSDLGDCAFWIVTRGFRPHGEKMLKIYEMLHDLAIEEFKTKKLAAEVQKAKDQIAAGDAEEVAPHQS